MVGSSFIYTVCGKRRTLLNTAQIASVHVNDVDVDSEPARRRYEEYDPLEGKIYLLTIVMANGLYSEYLYATAEDRDKMYDGILAALAPAATIIDTSPDVPRKPEGPKTVYNGYTAAEIEHAMSVVRD
ncbi:hypothetical protein [Hymenobacter convexus]|uniref:hypothetical protein n=1 Tax=Hymenobacter sp. CA1UV-4 TaxID=3063782 RepID=UPI00271313FE|nr:hypothetical protein [Hymenobacter sp. CA1UV-4]MDO7851365.1 hypothetical protein [Hymenobacter sp. CA1UV-4]